MNSSFISRVREAAKKGIIFTEHALDRMNQENEMISTEEVNYPAPRDVAFRKAI